MNLSKKVLGVAMVALFIASAISLTTARPIPDDCLGIYAINRIPQEVTVTSYYGNGTICESKTIQAHQEGAPADSEDILVPKEGKVGVGDVYLYAQDERGYISQCDISYGTSTRSGQSGIVLHG